MTVFEKQNGSITLRKNAYLAKIGRAYNRGRIHALKDVGYSIPEIVKALGLNESTVRSVVNEGM